MTASAVEKGSTMLYNTIPQAGRSQYDLHDLWDMTASAVEKGSTMLYNTIPQAGRSQYDLHDLWDMTASAVEKGSTIYTYINTFTYKITYPGSCVNR